MFSLCSLCCELLLNCCLLVLKDVFLVWFCFILSVCQLWEMRICFSHSRAEVLIFSLMRKMLMKGMLNMIPFSVPRGLFCPPPSEEQCYSCVMWNSKLCCAVLRSEQEPFKLSGSSCHLWLAQMCPDVWLCFCNLLSQPNLGLMATVTKTVYNSGKRWYPDVNRKSLTKFYFHFVLGGEHFII